jgi:hypothetical protein
LRMGRGLLQFIFFLSDMVYLLFLFWINLGFTGSALQPLMVSFHHLSQPGEGLQDAVN